MSLRTRIGRANHSARVYASALSGFESLMRDATPTVVQQANDWYRSAREFAWDLVFHRRRNGFRPWTLEVSASVVSAFSPRVMWKTNKTKAFAYANGQTPRGLKAHVAAADRCVLDGFDGLRGLKTNAFARAICGDPDAVVVDVWMCRAAGLTKDAPNRTEYAAISEAVREVARRTGRPAAVTQAMLWILIRGAAD